MKKFLILVMAISTLILVGCQSGKTVSEDARADLESDLKSVLSNTRSLESGSFDLELIGDVELVQQSGANKVSFDSNLLVSYGLADEATRLRDVAVNLVLNYVMDGASDSVAAELLVKERALYANLASLPTPLAAFGASGLVGQWLKFEVPEEFLTNPLFESIFIDSNLIEETEEDERLEELYNEIQFFKEIRDHGTVRSDGKTLRKYSVVFDNDAILEYYRRSAEVLNEDVTEEDISNLEAVLKDMSLSMEFLISEDNYLAGLSGELSFNISENAENIKLNLEFEVTMTELESGFEVEVPADAVDFMEAMMMM